MLSYSQQWSVNYFPVSEKKLEKKKHHRNNIFFIVADGLTGIDILNHHFSVNKVTNVKENLISKGFIFPKNAISSYNMTYLTLAAVHNVGYPVYETSKTYEDRSLFYPSILFHKTPLISHLTEANYNYRHYTNLWAPCDRKHAFPCFDANVSSGLPIKFDESIFVFFQKSLITMVFKKIRTKNWSLMQLVIYLAVTMLTRLDF